MRSAYFGAATLKMMERVANWRAASPSVTVIAAHSCLFPALPQ
ncbi:MAG: hypothetical protein ABIP81_07230 [Terriglobales bacterium]